MLCLIAKLDDGATRRLDGLRRAIPRDPDRRPLYGHVTLAAYTGDREEQFVRACREILADFSAFSVEIREIKVLEETSIIVALPEKAGALEEIHRRVAAQFEDELDKWTRSGVWRPHVTLFFGPGADLQGLCRSMSAAFTPFWARVSAVELSRVLDPGYAIIDRVPLPDDEKP